MASITYNAMYTTLVNLLKGRCVNIGTDYSSSFPSSMRNGSTAYTCTIPRTGADASNSNTGTATVKWEGIPSVVSETTFTSNLKSFFSGKGINCDSTSAVIPKYATYFINIAAIFVASQIKYTNDSGTVYYFYVPTGFPTVSETAPTKGPIQEIDITNVKNQFASIISLQSGPISILSGSLTAASSSSLFVAYFDIG